MAISASQIEARKKVTVTKRNDGLVFVHAPRTSDGTAATLAYKSAQAAKVLGVKEPKVIEAGGNRQPHTKAPHGAQWTVFGA